ncbi:hypothetical protein LshimejAT787_0701940 [Lyophyllum shimeji]|uniref:C2H2-type domain-containing protein n=1 Tax=Lyophyllum shimeji TaxID=47721 RepID=A0A9P3ULU4_LYOSH|nr:hypothetical protein LshimejAT787_0701940 [Lyophyllum shimeji]
MDESDAWLLPPREEHTYNHDSPAFSDTSTNFTGSDGDFWYSHNSSATSICTSPSGPLRKPGDQDILPSPPSPLRDISFEDRQYEIKTQVFDSHSSSDNSQPSEGQSQHGSGDSTATDPNDPSSQETNASSEWTDKSQEDGPPDQRMDVDLNPKRAVHSSPGLMDVDMISGDSSAASMPSSEAASMGRTGLLRRSNRVGRRKALASSYGGRPASQDIPHQISGPSNIGRRALSRNASPPSRTGIRSRISRKESEESEHLDSSAMPTAGRQPASESASSGTRNQTIEDLGGYFDPSSDCWRCNTCADRTFVTEASLMRHMKQTKAHRDPADFFFCGDCEEKFTRPDALSRHRQNVHGRRR